MKTKLFYLLLPTLVVLPLCLLLTQSLRHINFSYESNSPHESEGLVRIITCPTEYPELYWDDELRRNEYDDWKNDYLNEFPYSSIIEQQDARYKYWVEQGCKNTITENLGSEYKVYDDLPNKPFEFKNYPAIQKSDLPQWKEVQIELAEHNNELENDKYTRYHIGYFAGKFKVYFLKSTLFTGEFTFRDHFSDTIYYGTWDSSAELHHKINSKLLVIKDYSWEDPEAPNQYKGEFYNYFLFDDIKGFIHLGSYVHKDGQFTKIENLNADAISKFEED